MRKMVALAALAAAMAGLSEEAVPLWSGGKVPRMAELKRLEGIEFSVIKRHEPEKDGYHFLHGVALCWHKGKLYASYGTNKGLENTSAEETHVRASADGGRTWGDIEVVSSDGGPGLGISHGSLAELNGELWCFSGAFSNLQAATHTIAFTHTRAYVLDDATGHWRPRGMVASLGFWPMQNPIRMPDGNWIMGGLRVASGWNLPGGARPAAAISHGDDFTRWDVSVVQDGEVPGGIWGEATVDVWGPCVTLTVRPGWKEEPPVAHVATSADGGRTWTPLRPTNLPAASSKPFTGILSTGQRYLISQTTADGGRGRAPLTIAVGSPGEWSYSRVFLIRPSVFPEGPGPSPARALAYPSAVEHEGRLYVAYSNSGRGGNQSNSSELAIIPVSALDLPQAAKDSGEDTAHDARHMAARWARMTQAERKAREREIMHGLAELELQSPWITENLAGRKYRPENLTFAMNAGVAETPRGRLWAVWFGGEDNSEAFMLGARSDDGGRTWSAPQFAVDTHFPGNKVFEITVKRSILVGEIWCAPDGTLRLYVNQSLESFDGRGSTWEFVCRNPDADKPEWGRPRYVWHGLQHNKPTVATTGEWIMPLNLSIGHAGLFPELDALRGAGMLVSTDQGENWRPRGFVRVKGSYECSENMVVERRDGSWQNFMRTDFGIMQCESSDRGITWTEPAPMPGVRHPVSRFSITRLASGNWLLVKNGRTVDSFDERNERTLLTAWLSADEGATWTGGLMLDGRPRSKDYGACYPDVCQCRDGSICATWDYDRRVSAEIGFARFTEDDVRAGRIVNPRSFLGAKVTAASNEKMRK